MKYNFLKKTLILIKFIFYLQLLKLMQKLKLPKAKLFYFLISLEKKGVITSEEKGILKGIFFIFKEHINNI